MKKLSLLVLVMLLAIPTQSFARAKMRNVFASWYSVTGTQTTITLPYESQDIIIRNGDASTNVFVDLIGATIPDTTFVTNSPTRPTTLQLDPDSQIDMKDFFTSSIGLRTVTGTASPVTVIIRY